MATVTLCGDTGPGFTAQSIGNAGPLSWAAVTAAFTGLLTSIVVGHNHSADTARAGIYASTGTVFLGGSAEIASTTVGLNTFDISAAKVSVVAGTSYCLCFFVSGASYFRPYQSTNGTTHAPQTTAVKQMAATYPTWPGSLAPTSGGFGNNNVQMYATGTGTYLTSGTTFSVPADWNSGANSIACLGAGGAGDPGVGSTQAGAGGGGGAFSLIVNQTLTPRSPVNRTGGVGR